MRILESCELDFLFDAPKRLPVKVSAIELGPLTDEELEESNKQNKKYLQGL
jgi:hypothetical protein